MRVQRHALYATAVLFYGAAGVIAHDVIGSILWACGAIVLLLLWRSA